MKQTCQFRQRQHGMTLIELLIVIVIASIILALAVPAFSRLAERKRLEGAVENVFADFQFAKAETIKLNNAVFVTFDPTNECYGLALATGSTPNCDCTETDVTQADACTVNGDTLRVVQMADFGQTELDSATAFGSGEETRFDPRRGRAMNQGTAFLDSPLGYQAQVIISTLRIRICSLAGAGKVIALEDC